MAGCGHGCVMAVAYARYSHADASAAQGPKVCRLFAGGKWIRNFGPWGRQVLRRNPNSFREIDKARRLGTVAILARNRKFESIPLQQTVRVSPDFALPGRKAGLFRGCAGRNRQRGRERPAWRGDMAPTGGNISVGPNFSTAAWMKTVS